MEVLDLKERSEEGGETKIPVFTVLKKGTILKNIFLNDPPPPLPGTGAQSDEIEEGEDKLLIGRHPDCHIVLDHPSISRFHLEVRLLRSSSSSSQKLLVTDLSSVHGTWVSGKKIKPRVPVELAEGDVLKLGASTRVYVLQWVPQSRVFELENPLSPLPEEKEETHQDENSMPILDCFHGPWVATSPSAPLMPETMILQFASSPLPVEGEVKTRDYIPETKDPVSPPPGEGELSPPRSEKRVMSSDLLSRRGKSIVFLRIHTERSKERIGEVSYDTKVGVEKQEGIDMGIAARNEEESLCKVLFPGPGEANANEVEEEEEIFYSDKENFTPDYSSSQMLKKGQRELLQRSHLDVASDLNGEEKEVLCYSSDKENQGEMKTGLTAMKGEKLLCKALFPASEELSAAPDDGRGGDVESYISDKENMTPKVPMNIKFKRVERVLSRSSLYVSTDLKGEEMHCSDKENSTQNLINIAEELYHSDKENSTQSLSNSAGVLKGISKVRNSSSKNGMGLQVEEVPQDVEGRKLFSEDKIRIAREEDEREMWFGPDKENLIPKHSGDPKAKEPLSENRQRIEREIIKRRVERVPFQFLWENSVESTRSPVSESKERKSGSRLRADNQILRRRVEKRVPFQSLEENSFHSTNSPGSNASSPIYSGSGPSKLKEHMSENQVKTEMEMINVKRKGERIPFQSLLDSPVSKSKSSVSNTDSQIQNSAIQSVEQVFQPAKGRKKKWNIVADISCFISEESRRSLQLLEGIRGTHLIIPRMVIRELDCLKRRESLFRKATKATSVLQWIEECMVNTSWWIHVQSSGETMPVAPTPPASPRPELHEISNRIGSISNTFTFSTCGSLAEIITPTAEDHILDCALLFKRMKYDEQLVLLTDSISLKIKAMAEGLLCETPIEFRESLVSPFSERFLWAESSPRGPTWSVSDEVDQIENQYHHCPTIRKSVKAAEGAKGLKLILLHNSHYGLLSCVR